MIAQYIKEKGMQEGIQQGIQQGVQQGIQQAVLMNLEIKFGSVPGALREKIGAIKDLARLKSLQKHSILSSSLREFGSILEKGE